MGQLPASRRSRGQTVRRFTHSPFCCYFAAPAAVANSIASQLGGGIEDGTDDFVVAGALAEVAGEPVARRSPKFVRWSTRVQRNGIHRGRAALASAAVTSSENSLPKCVRT